MPIDGQTSASPLGGQPQRSCSESLPSALRDGGAKVGRRPGEWQVRAETGMLRQRGFSPGTATAGGSSVLAAENGGDRTRLWHTPFRTERAHVGLGCG